MLGKSLASSLEVLPSASSFSKEASFLSRNSTQASCLAGSPTSLPLELVCEFDKNILGNGISNYHSGSKSTWDGIGVVELRIGKVRSR